MSFSSVGPGSSPPPSKIPKESHIKARDERFYHLDVSTSSCIAEEKADMPPDIHALLSPPSDFAHVFRRKRDKQSLCACVTTATTTSLRHIHHTSLPQVDGRVACDDDLRRFCSGRSEIRKMGGGIEIEFKRWRRRLGMECESQAFAVSKCGVDDPIHAACLNKSSIHE